MMFEVLEIDAPSALDAYGEGDYAAEASAAFDAVPDCASAAQIAEEAAGYADRLLTALATMAIRSKRREADLSAALRRAGLDTDQGRVTEALRHLEATGCIEQLVPLYDGGVLMLVTTRGIEHLSSAPRWTMLDGGRLFGRS